MMLGLAAIIDQSPSWEVTPFWLRLMGKPRWRSYRYVSGEYVYAHVKPAAIPMGIDRSSGVLWRTNYSSVKQGRR